EMIAHVARSVTGSDEVTPGDQTISFAGRWKRIPLFDAIQEHAGVQLTGLDRNALAEAASSLGLDVDETMGSGKIIDEVFGTFVEPKLIQPTFIIDYPISLSPLAKRH